MSNLLPMSSAWNNLKKNYDRVTSCSDTYCHLLSSFA